MSDIVLPAHGWKPRKEQKPFLRYILNAKPHIGCKEAHLIWHRRMGKDECVGQLIQILATRRIGTYWHVFPTKEQARNVIWKMVNAHTGNKRIYDFFDKRLIKSVNNTNMTVEFINGSVYQMVGSDSYDSLIGGGIVFAGFSEWAYSDVGAWSKLQPMLEETNGLALFISTPNGRNHAHRMYEHCKQNGGFAEILSARDTTVFTNEQLDRILQNLIAAHGYDFGSAIFQQEYLCSFDSALLGSILGRDISIAETDGRISNDIVYKTMGNGRGSPLFISCDLGHRDTAVFTFWQPDEQYFNIIDFADGWGINAEEWAMRIEIMLYKYENNLGKIFMPHDAAHENAAAKYTWIQHFVNRFGADKVEMVPKSYIPDRVNAARIGITKTRINSSLTRYIESLRNWAYDYDDKRGVPSEKPIHDKYSHYGDSYSYGCQVMNNYVRPIDKPAGFTYNELHMMTKEYYKGDINYG